MAKAPAFQFYPADFTMGTMLFSNEETGIYIRLLCLQWENGRLPGDKKVLRSLARCPAAKLDRVLTKFCMDTEGYFNSRMEAERMKQAAFRERQAQNGHKRWVADDTDLVKDGNAKPHAMPDANSHAKAMPVREDRDRRMKTESPEFTAFWKAYPKRKNKGDAEKAWGKLPQTQEFLEVILGGIERAKKSFDWQKEGGQFIPYPASWLNAKGWEDEGLLPLNGKSSLREKWEKSNEGLSWGDYQKRAF